MSIYRFGKVWYIDLPTSQGRLRRSAGTTDKKQAQTYHDRVRDQLWRQERLGEKAPITWEEAVLKWLEIKPRGKPDRYRLRSLKIDPRSALPLPPDCLNNYSTTNSNGTWNRLLSLVVAIHNASGVKPPEISRKPMPPGRTRWLSLEEWQKLRGKLLARSPLLVDCADFTLATGLRENNVLNLEWSQVDLKRHHATIYGDTVKTGVTLGIPLTDAAMGVLERRKGLHKRYVFANPDLPLYKASNKAWYQALRDANMVGFRWHDLRHTWASWAVMNGVSLMELKELGGWKTLSMVARYSHLSSQHLGAAAAKVKPVSVGAKRSRKT